MIDHVKDRLWTNWHLFAVIKAVLPVQPVLLVGQCRIIKGRWCFFICNVGQRCQSRFSITQQRHVDVMTLAHLLWISIDLNNLGIRIKQEDTERNVGTNPNDQISTKTNLGTRLRRNPTSRAQIGGILFIQNSLGQN